MADVDHVSGSTASGDLGEGASRGGGSGGDQPCKGVGKGPTGHSDEKIVVPKAPVLSADLASAKKIAKHNHLTYLDDHGFHDLRTPDFRATKGVQLPLTAHTSYPIAALINAKGTINQGGERCTKCGVNKRKKTGNYADCVSFDKDVVYKDLTKKVKVEGVIKEIPAVPFNGSCGNCFHGGQASQCSLRVDGQTVPPRMTSATAVSNTGAAAVTNTEAAAVSDTEAYTDGSTYEEDTSDDEPAYKVKVARKSIRQSGRFVKKEPEATGGEVSAQGETMIKKEPKSEEDDGAPSEMKIKEEPSDL